MSRRFAILSLAVVLATAAAAASSLIRGPAQAAGRADVEVVVRLRGAPVTRGRSLDSVVRAQRRFDATLHERLPAARIRWRYRLVLNGVAVVLPQSDLRRLAAIPDVAHVYLPARYTVEAGPAGDQIGAPQLWAPGLQNAGDGMKIAIVDDGVDQNHPFFNPAGYTMPSGFPKGQTAYTNAKVIAARVFPAPGQKDPGDLVPFEREESHGTHVAGIAAGNAGTKALGATISGVAPRAYIGNYRALTVPTDGGFGDDGNAAELVAAVEAAVADGMDVINFSIGEFEIEPSRDVVALALDGAAAAGVVSVVSAGNDFEEYGGGSISSPASAEDAIAVGAVTTNRDGQTPNVVADFSSAGPTPLSLRLKPEIAAPGSAILSSLPDGWGTLSGTSMAAPHVTGGVALLRQRHPDWTASQVKAALVETGRPAWLDPERMRHAGPTRVGGGVVDLVSADKPLVFSDPSTVSFGLLPAGRSVTVSIALTDAGGGAGTWSVSIESAGAGGAQVQAPPTVDVPGTLVLTATAGAAAKEGELGGTVVLQRAGVERRIPIWLRVTRSRLGQEPVTELRKSGDYSGDTRGRPSLVSAYRYPQRVPGGSQRLAGPEQVFRVLLMRPVENFGVVITARGSGVKVQPRVVVGDENRLTGYAALPIISNPYLASYGRSVLVAGALRPAAGAYEVVFDSATSAGAGRFRFHLWIDDVQPPVVRLRSRTVRIGQPLRLRATDSGSGVAVETAVARIDGMPRRVLFRNGELQVDTQRVAAGRHRLAFQVSDYQETRNDENVAAVLPNTRRISTPVTLRP
jgi:subtilisin family serine protease